MSGFETKRTAANGSGTPGLGTVSTFDEATLSGSNQPVAVGDLSFRFGALSFIENQDDIAFYRGCDRRPGDAEGQRVTLKILEDHADPSTQPQLFRLETLAAACLSHRNIIRSEPPEEYQGLHFSVVESRPTFETLRSLLDRQGWLELELAVKIVQQLADALNHAHGLGFLHLRLHPKNILVDSNGAVLLTDFGLDAGAEFSWAHRERTRRCPIHYISPEQASEKPLDPRCDLYSLGVVFYQMLTDRLPLDSGDSESVRQQHIAKRPLAPHFYSSEVPLAISAIVCRLLEKDPDKRFPDVASFREELDRSASLERVNLEPDEERPLILDTVDEDDQEPINVENLMNPPDREAWEPPSITVIDPPITESVVIGPGTDAIRLDTPSPNVDFGSRFDRNNQVPGSEVNFRSSTQLRPIMMVVILTTAVITGLLVRARSNVSEPRSPDPIPAATTRSGGDSPENRNTGLPSSSRSDGGLVVDGHQPPRNQPIENTGIAATVPGASRPAKRMRGARQPIIQRSSKVRRTDKTRRRWWRPTHYFR